MKFRERLYRFMQGRNGVDALTKFMNRVSLVCLIAAIFFTFLSLVCLTHGGNTAALVFRILYYVFYGFGIIVGFVENGGSISPKGVPASDSGTASTWICPDCKTENPKSATRCQECGAFRKVSE